MRFTARSFECTLLSQNEEQFPVVGDESAIAFSLPSIRFQVLGGCSEKDDKSGRKWSSASQDFTGTVSDTRI
jgi:hypothetical protein